MYKSTRGSVRSKRVVGSLIFQKLMKGKADESSSQSMFDLIKTHDSQRIDHELNFSIFAWILVILLWSFSSYNFVSILFNFKVVNHEASW